MQHISIIDSAYKTINQNSKAIAHMHTHIYISLIHHYIYIYKREDISKGSQNGLYLQIIYLHKKNIYIYSMHQDREAKREDISIEYAYTP